MLQTSELELALRDTQTRMYALDMMGDERETALGGGKLTKPSQSLNEIKVEDGYNVAKLRVQDVAERGALTYMVSTYDFRDNIIRDNDRGMGRKVVTFNNILRHNVYPLAEAVDFMLKKGQQEMQRPVEIEFAGMVEPGGKTKGRLYWLQIRPIVDRKENVDEAVMSTPDEHLLLKSSTALGHGTIEGVSTVVYVRPDKFSSSNNSLIAREMEKINRGFLERDERYLLIGPALGLVRLRSRHPREMAGHLGRTPHRRVIAPQLPHRAEPGHTLLPESHLVWRGLLHHRLSGQCQTQGGRPCHRPLRRSLSRLASSHLRE